MAEIYETSHESWGERELDFNDIEGQQKLSVQRNRTTQGSGGISDVEMRVKITQHSDILGRKVYGVVHKVCWGTYEGKLACLLVVRFRFTPGSILSLRKASVTIHFDNHPASKGSYSQVGNRGDPVLHAFSPRHIYGIPTDVEHQVVWSVAAQCSVSVGPASLGPEASRESTTRYTTQAALEIAGMDDADDDKDLPNIVTFDIDQTSKTSRDIPKELYFGAVVECDGPIQADIETSIGDRSAWPWTQDDPIVMKPGDNYGHVPPQIPQDFHKLTDDDWKILVPYLEENTNAVQWRAP